MLVMMVGWLRQNGHPHSKEHPNRPSPPATSTLRWCPHSNEGIELTTLPFDDQRREAIEQSNTALLHTDRMGKRQVDARAKDTRPVPAPCAVLDVKGIATLGPERADGGVVREGDPRLLSDFGVVGARDGDSRGSKDGGRHQKLFHSSGLPSSR